MHRSPHDSGCLRHGHAIKIGLDSSYLCGLFRRRSSDSQPLMIEDDDSLAEEIDKDSDRVRHTNYPSSPMVQSGEDSDRVRHTKNALIEDSDPVRHTNYPSSPVEFEDGNASMMKRIEHDRFPQEFRRAAYWFRDLGNGEVEKIVMDGAAGVSYNIMLMPYLGEVMSDYIHQLSHESILKIVQNLSNTLIRMREKRDGTFYHGDIKPENIVVDREDHTSVFGFANCYLPGDAMDTFHCVTKEFLPRDLRTKLFLNETPTPCLLDPTVDELAFVRTVYEMVNRGIKWITNNDHVVLYGCADETNRSFTNLSQFLNDVQEKLDEELKYDMTDNFENNRKAVNNAVKMAYTSIYKQDLQTVATVYAAVQAILRSRISC